MKKTLKVLGIIIGFVLVVLIVVIAYFYNAFNNFSVEDKAEIKQENLQYFNDSYQKSRSLFIKKAKEFEKYSATTFAIPVASKIDNDLTIDICYIPSITKTNKIIVMSSGVHGVEGFTGSAVQMFFMDKYINEQLLNNTAILIIHSVNPYGFKYNRRVTENNVDLNRNSDINKDLYKSKNEGYTQIVDFVNPKGKVDCESSDNKFFFIFAIKKIIKASMKVLRQAVLQGQYEYSNGLYYGGSDSEPQIKKLVPVIDSICKPYNTIFAIDLHTGYGERDRLHLFPNPAKEPVRKLMTDIFEGFKIDWGDSDNFYTVTGDFVGYIGKINKDKIFIPIAFEFGTMNSSQTIGSIKSLHVMILENQGAHYGYKSKTDSLKVQKDIREMYYPSSEKWRTNVIDKTKLILDKSLKRFTEKY